jgi:hypothetical protein
MMVGCVTSCTSYPPTITGITICPADPNGEPRGIGLCRTAVGPPVPVIGVLPGADPQRSAMWLNDPRTGQAQITLARGRQNFVLHCALIEPSDHFVIAVYLDEESAPSLTALVDHDPAHPIRASPAAMVRGFGGPLIANHSAQSVVRNGFRVTLHSGAFQLEGVAVDPISPLALRPDGVPDRTGVLTIDVEPEHTPSTLG